MIATAPLKRELRLALVDAFPLPSDLRMLVVDVLNERLENVSLASNVPTIVFDLIEWARPRGRLTELVVGAAAERPRNEALRRLAAQFEFAAPAPGEEERILRPDVPFQNAAEWAVRYNHARAAVCRIEPQPLAQSNNGYGTGFLIAPDVVMTNFHVIDRAPGDPDPWKPEQVILRFDCETGPDDKETAGRVCKLAADWKVATSKRVEDGGCDYALLRLAERVGDDALASGPRGAMKLHSRSFRTGQPVFILQHPMASPMRLAIGSVTSPSYSPVQIAYNANTDNGSSGSPCLDAALQVVALHHRGGPDNNQGVKAESILRDMANHADAAVRQFAGQV